MFNPPMLEKVLDPNLGLRPTVNVIAEAVQIFLHGCRPRGKSLPDSASLCSIY